MPTPQAPDALDDLPLELPRSDGGSEDQEEHDESAFDDADDGDDTHETIGLDVSVGFDQEAELDDLIDDVDAEDRRWTEGTEAASDQVAIDTRDLADGSEYGWTNDNDDAGDAVAHRDDELDDGDLPTLGLDAGDGLDDERTDAVDDDTADLPPIDAADADGDDGALDASLLGQLDQVAEHEVERILVAEAHDRAGQRTPAVYWNVFPKAQIRPVFTTQLGSPAQASGGTTMLHALGRLWLLEGDSLVSAENTPTRLTLPGKHVTGIMREPGKESLLISADTGLWRVTVGAPAEHLGGPSADPVMIANAEITCLQDGAASRLWAMSRLGSLFARYENPARWSLIDAPRPGRHLASDGRRAMAYVHAPAHRPCVLMRSADGGTSWQPQTIPVSDASLVRQLHVCRDVVVLVCESMTDPIQAWLRDDEPLALPEGLRTPLTLVYEDGEVVLYGCVVLLDRIALIRHPVGKRHRKPMVVRSWPANSAQMPTAIAGFYDGEHTKLAWISGSQLECIALEIQRDGGA